MKQRNGFVSNSSSSSFIIGFNKDPMIKENVAEELGHCEFTHVGYSYGLTLHTEDIVDDVHKKLVRVGLATEQAIYDQLSQAIPWGACSEENGYPQFDNRNPGIDDEYADAVDAWCKKYIETNEAFVQFRNGIKGKHVYIVEYDDDGRDAAYETGKPFRNVVSMMRVSHH